MKSTFAGAAALALFAVAPAMAQNETVPANVYSPAPNTAPATTSPAEDQTDRAADPAPSIEPAIPAPTTGTVATTTTTPDLALPPVEPVNPYANSYNELEPLMVEEDQGFDDWGLLGLLGLLGLFGLRRGHERVVYVERAETVRTMGEPPVR